MPPGESLGAKMLWIIILPFMIGCTIGILNFALSLRRRFDRPLAFSLGVWTGVIVLYLISGYPIMAILGSVVVGYPAMFVLYHQTYKKWVTLGRPELTDV
jgi:uncharacterized membrane protein